MADLIDRQAALDNAWQVMYKDEWHMTQTEQVVSVNDIEALPTVDPVKHGKWLQGRSKGEWVCSECRCVTETPNDIPTAYCGFCGARME